MEIDRKAGWGEVLCFGRDRWEVNLLTSRTVVRCAEQEAIVAWMSDAWGYPGTDMFDGGEGVLFSMLIDAVGVLCLAQVNAEFGGLVADAYAESRRRMCEKPDAEWDCVDHFVYGIIEAVSAGVSRATDDWLRL